MKAGRYFITSNNDPYFNMALDEWLFFRFCNNPAEDPSILRLYSWKAEAITIGYNQVISKVVDGALLDRNMPIIKRITGGRAICHDPSEITFSLILDLDLMPGGRRSLSATNQIISRTLVDIFRESGIESRWERKSLEERSGVNRRGDKISCFDSVSRYELTSGQTKIAAGAQRRRGNYMIHQGSIKINGIVACPAIGQKPDFTLSREGKKGEKAYSIDDISDDFRVKFSESLGVEFESSYLSFFEGGEFREFLEIFGKKYKEMAGFH